MRKASLILGVLTAAALVGALAAPSAWAQGSVKPGGPVGGGGAGSSTNYVVPAGSFGGAAARSASTNYTLYGGPAAAVPIGPAITSGMMQVPEAGSEAHIPAVVTNGVNTTMYLYYRLGGEGTGSYHQVTMTTADNVNYVGTIPGSDVGVRGLECYFYGVNGSPSGGVTTRPYRNARTSPLQYPVHVTDYASLNPPDAQYRLVGFSFSVSPSDVASVFVDDLGDTNQARWKLGRWDNTANAYDSYYDVGPVRRGRGYWLIRRGTATVDASGQSTFPDTTVSNVNYAKIVLQPGWNQIANPFGFPVSWSGVLDPSSAVEDTLHAWNGTTYEHSSLLEPFTGYWVNNVTDATPLLLVPMVEAIILGKSPASAGSHAAVPASAIPVAPASPDGWRLGLTLTAGDLVDAGTEIGAAPGASDGADALDYGKPPCPPGRFVALGLLSGAEGSRPQRLAGDIRAPGGEGWRFRLLAQGAQAGPATLRLVGADRLPGGGRIALVDPQAGVAYDVGADGAIVLPQLPTPEGARYDLVVGPEAWVEGEVGPTTTMPRRHALDPCYPNPFNPRTKIAFELPAPSHVRLEVLDVAGRRVAVLLDEACSGGRHVIEWAGLDGRGRAVASGTYYYRMSADGFTRTRAMTLLK